MLRAIRNRATETLARAQVGLYLPPTFNRVQPATDPSGRRRHRGKQPPPSSEPLTTGTTVRGLSEMAGDNLVLLSGAGLGPW
jgi:hypothetical protein